MNKHRLVLPGPRRSDLRKRRLRYIAVSILVIVVALGWFGYRQLFGASAGAWFSGP